MRRVRAGSRPKGRLNADYAAKVPGVGPPHHVPGFEGGTGPWLLRAE
jgi:hypothetical protein